MDNLNIFQKTRIILLVLIVIATIVLVISAVKSKDKQNYIAQETISSLDAKKIEPSEDDTSIKVESILGDVLETEDTSWDEQNVEETKVEEEVEKNKEKYYLKINYTANVVTAYTKDKDGKYTVPARAMICSTGKATPTSGVYKMSSKYRWHQLNGGVYGQYCSRITGHILFHSVPYSTNSPDSLKYVAYDKLGTKASAGCIRLTVADAMWVYSNCPSGTCVEFYSSSDPGPLGKPSAQKISSNETCRNWDPTDPTSGNPWHTYKEPEPVKEEPKEDTKQKTENNTKNNKKEEKPATTKEPTTQNNENTQNTENKNDNASVENKDTENTAPAENTQEEKDTPSEDTKKEDDKKENQDEKQDKKEESKPDEKPDEKTNNSATNENSLSTVQGSVLGE